ANRGCNRSIVHPHMIAERGRKGDAGAGRRDWQGRGPRGSAKLAPASPRPSPPPRAKRENSEPGPRRFLWLECWLMRVLVVGSGGREHALAWAISASPLVDRLFCAPGNAGIAEETECIAIGATDIKGLVEFC